MPVTINGNGTITGYTPPIADGSITAAKLASGAITSSALPTGSVIQVVQHSFTNETSSSSTSDVAISGSAKALTLTSSSSSVLIIASIYCRWYRSYSGHGISLTLRKTVSGGSITDIYEPKGSGMMAFDLSLIHI